MLDHKLSFYNENDSFIKKNIVVLMEKIMGVRKLNDLLYKIRLKGGYSNIGSGLVHFFKWEMKGVDTHFLKEDLKEANEKLIEAERCVDELKIDIENTIIDKN